jgi:hypothetical protein
MEMEEWKGSRYTNGSKNTLLLLTNTSTIDKTFATSGVETARD